MTDFNRILVAVNSLSDRDAAFDRALALAQSSSAELYVLYAVPVNERFSYRATERLERMARMRQRAEDAGVAVHTVEQHGDAARTIVLHAHARDAALIVMGGEVARGWGRRSRVAERVIGRANVPTLVVASGAADSSPAFRKALVAVDLSPDSDDVLRGAVALTARSGAQLTVLHAVADIQATELVQLPGWWMAPQLHTPTIDDAHERLQALVAPIPGSLDTRVQLLTGPAARTITDVAARIDADLVVVGRSRGFKLLGSTAQRVVRQNDRALLVVPGATGRAGQADWQLAA